jgi:hypothetical protein
MTLRRAEEDLREVASRVALAPDAKGLPRAREALRGSNVASQVR